METDYQHIKEHDSFPSVSEAVITMMVYICGLQYLCWYCSYDHIISLFLPYEFWESNSSIYSKQLLYLLSHPAALGWFCQHLWISVTNGNWQVAICYTNTIFLDRNPGEAGPCVHLVLYPWGIFFRSDICLFVCLSICCCMCVHVHTRVVQHMDGAQVITYRSLLSVSTMWVMEMETRSPDLVAGILYQLSQLQPSWGIFTLMPVVAVPH